VRLSDLAVIDWHIEVDAQENTLVAEVQVSEFSNHDDFPFL